MDKNLKPKISVVIPCYEMSGKGVDFLARAIDSIESQTFKNYEIVIADNSDDNLIEDFVKGKNLVYFKNPRKGMAQNTNEAMTHANGELIKILYQDDCLSHDNALEEIVDIFTDDVNWLATGCIHNEGGENVRPHYPSYTHEIYKGMNTIGSPSVITLRNKDLILFDEKMTWLLDVDYYRRMYDKYGEPKFLYKINVVMGLGKHQVTNLLAETLKRAEYDYMMKKYE